MKRIFWVAGILIVIAAVLGYREMSPGDQKKSETQSGSSSESSGRRSGRRSGGGGAVVPVTIGSVVQKNVPLQITGIGAVDPYSTVSIRAQVTGTIMNAHFNEGQDVKKGEELFTIDPRPYEAALKQAQAVLAKDMSLLENAREQARRYAELVKKEYVSREQYDQIQASSNASEAAVDADRAAVENAKVQLSYCHIYSPMDGRTGSLLVNEGNLVRTNDATPLVTINQITPIYVTFSLPEKYLPAIKEAMARGKLKVDAMIPQADERLETGFLTFIDNTVDRTTGTIKLKATFPNTTRRLWPGQFVKVGLTLADQPNAIVAPAQAIQMGQQGQHVFVVKPDSAVEVRPVIVSRTLGEDAVIEKGLQPGEKVVTEGQFLLGPGTKVQVKKDTKGKEVES